ncbi:EAL domain-containing protein [Pontibacterium sp. N1Y112]|uniref:cyclic-guanylate-specific phosphodiesterase n=1 Tax=Pontibacterium sinense TaxID=2781979 RepID=A0A8J7FEH7_9GAMM|nr:EAL domain-containing protein [Pontibacterium sinense]MBE9398169.1 EAL domain-containing protein [Pontibacterium sinense]
MNKKGILFALTVVCALAAVVSVYLNYHYSAALLTVQLERKEGQRDAQVVASKLDVFLENQQRLVETVAGLPALRDYMHETSAEGEQKGRYLLDLVCRTQKASICYALDDEGTITIHNSDIGPVPLKGKNFAFRPYFKNALTQRQDIYAAYGVTTRKRGVYFSQLMADEQDHTLGVMVVKLAADRIDEELTKERRNLMLVDSQGIVFAATNSDWILKSLWPLSEIQQKQVLSSRQFGDTRIESLGFEQVDDAGRIKVNERDFVLEKAPLERLNGWQVFYLREGYPVTTFNQIKNLTELTIPLFGVLSLIFAVMFLRWRQSLKLQVAEERKRVKTEARLYQLGDISNEGILIHRRGKIVDLNTVVERMFGYSREELASMEVWDLLAPESIAVGFHNVHTGMELPYEVQALRKDGREFPMEVFAKNSELEGESVRVACLRDITEFKQQEATIRYQAQFDLLTDLPNKQLFTERLKRSLEHAAENNTNVAVLYIDLDDFKKINDGMGHEAGDQLLIAVAQRLLSVTRIGDTLARYGADEFVMLLDEVNAESEAPRMAQQVLQELEHEFEIEEHRFYISGTVGIAIYPDDGRDEVSLLQHADIAMHRCKVENSGNSYGFYQSSMNEDVAVRVEMERHLRSALQNNELYLHYQPIFGSDDRRLLGAEVLVRWRSEELGFVGPDNFIPLAEQTGLIVEIGHWILKTACTQGRKWLDEGLKDFYLAVNISPRQLRHQDFIYLLKSVLDETGFPAQALVLELTEGLLVKKDSGTAQVLDDLKALGVMLSMDDFGTGYSSLAYLKMFPFDVIKIDRSFVRDLAVDASDQQLIVAAIEMAKALGLKVVAEGVETAQQLHFLRDAGCYSVQGYYLSKPIDPMLFSERIVEKELAERLVML